VMLGYAGGIFLVQWRFKMARMYSGRKGKAGSTKPSKRFKPVWVSYSKREIELLIQKLAREGRSSSQIGALLRDSYGIPDVRLFTEKPVTAVMRDKKLLGEIPEDLLALIRRAVNLRKHLDANRQDMSALRGLQLAESKIKHLVKYYKRVGRLPVDWKYDSESIKLYAE